MNIFSTAIPTWVEDAAVTTGIRRSPEPLSWATQVHVLAPVRQMLERGDVTGAASALDQLRHTHPRSSIFACELAVLLDVMGHRTQAKAILRQHSKHNPSDARALGYLGALHFMEGDHKAALQLFSESLGQRRHDFFVQTNFRTLVQRITRKTPIDYPAVPYAIATSIPPRDIGESQRALASWQRLGASIHSINTRKEIEKLQPHFEFVQFHTCNETGILTFGKEYQYLSNILAVLDTLPIEVCGILNSDIILACSDNDMRKILDVAATSFVFGSRLNVEKHEIHTGRIYERGFDYFFFPRAIASKIPKLQLCLGVHWWDYVFPWLAMQVGLSLHFCYSPVAEHVIHPANWNEQRFYDLGLYTAKLMAPPLAALLERSEASHVYMDELLTCLALSTYSSIRPTCATFLPLWMACVWLWTCCPPCCVALMTKKRTEMQYAPTTTTSNATTQKGHPVSKPVIASGQDALAALNQAGLNRPGHPLRLHLGCGENHLDGYINVDYPPDRHAVMTPRADIFADIKQLHFPDNCLDEIRLHHVFEHFNRVEALGLLIRWHRWLRVGGVLHIETPDLAGSAKTILDTVPFKQKCAAVRHLAGDQTETWAYHVDHWFPERFHATFTHMGFGEPKLRTGTWNKPPFLANVTAIGVKTTDLPTVKLLQAADELLWLSTVATSELPTYEVWKRQLRNFLAYRPVHPAPAPAADIRDLLPTPPDSPPLEDIHDFNQRGRDNWVAAKAAATPAGSAILDVGAGTCPYRQLFAHCRYTAHDFKGYEGVKLGGGTSYGEIDLIGDITAIPAPDASFDVVMCTEVLEHVPDPVAALREMVRLLRSGGRLLLTAPLGSGLHQEPFHYYGGFTRHFYERFLPPMGVQLVEITSNGGFFLHLAQECARVAWTFEQHKDFHGDRAEDVRKLFAEHLPRYLHAMDARYMNDAFTVGYFVEGVKA